MKATVLFAALALSACAVVPASPVVSSDRQIAPRGTAVPFNQPVWVANALVVTPLRLIEDSRCPADATCVWAGRALLETRLDGIGWRHTAQLEVDKPYKIRGQTVRLSAVEPEKRAERQIPVANYRFTFEGN